VKEETPFALGGGNMVVKKLFALRFMSERLTFGDCQPDVTPFRASVATDNLTLPAFHIDDLDLDLDLDTHRGITRASNRHYASQYLQITIPHFTPRFVCACHEYQPAPASDVTSFSRCNCS
jgi:hypothetical protein